MKKKIINTIITVLIIILAILSYPWFVKVDEDGNNICSNLLGYSYKCG